MCMVMYQQALVAKTKYEQTLTNWLFFPDELLFKGVCGILLYCYTVILCINTCTAVTINVCIYFVHVLMCRQN